MNLLMPTRLKCHLFSAREKVHTLLLRTFMVAELTDLRKSSY